MPHIVERHTTLIEVADDRYHLQHKHWLWVEGNQTFPSVVDAVIADLRACLSECAEQRKTEEVILHMQRNVKPCTPSGVLACIVLEATCEIHFLVEAAQSLGYADEDLAMWLRSYDVSLASPTLH